MKLITPFRIVLVFLIIPVLTILVLPRLRLDLIPRDGGDSFTVTYSLWNSPPHVVETQVTAVLENAFSKITGLQKIVSTSGYNQGRIVLNFPKNTDLAFKQFELVSIIRQIYPKLPANVSYPLVIPARAGNEESKTPLLVYSVQAQQQPYQIRQTVEDVVVSALAGIPGLQDAQLTGTEGLQLVIRFNNELCRLHQLEPARIINSIQAYFSDAYPGVTSHAGQQYFIRIKAPPADISIIEQIQIPGKDHFIRIKDIAAVSLEERQPGSYYRINGNNAINLSLYVRKGNNAVVLGKKLKATMAELSALLPAGYAMRLSYDDTTFLQKEIDKTYKRSILSVCILGVFILLAYRKRRYLFILSASLLVTLCTTILMAYIFRIDIHIYTIAGMAIAFGIILDNTIIVLDFRSQARAILPALITGTATTVAALSLIFFLPEEEQKNLYDFALIIIMALVASLVVAWLFMPGLYELVHTYRRSKQKPVSMRRKKRAWKRWYVYNNSIRFLARYRPIFIWLIIASFGLPLFLLPEKLEGKEWYVTSYNNTLGSKKYQSKIRPYLDKTLGGTWRLFVNSMHDRFGYRNMEKTTLHIDALLPVGSTIDQMNNILSDFDKYLGAINGIQTYVTHVYSGQYGSIMVTFSKEKELTELPYLVRSAIVVHAQDMGGVELNVRGVGEGFSNGTDQEETPVYRLIMKGYNYDELEKQATLLGERLAIMERVQKINTDDRMSPDERLGREYTLELNDDRMALLNGNKYAVVQGMKKMAIPGSYSTSLLLHDHWYPVVLQEKQSDNYSAFDVLNKYLFIDSTHVIKPREAGRIQLNTTAGAIYKENRQYVRTISFAIIGSYQLGENYIKQILEETKEQLPIGFSIIRDDPKKNDAGAPERYWMIGLLLTAIFFIGGMFFESLKKPFYIIVTIPVAFIGVFLSFAIGDFQFDQGGYAAFIMLGGLIANASIFIVRDVVIYRKKQPFNQNTAITKAVFNRSRTVMLTMLSVCCGLIPYLTDGRGEVFWFSFAIGTLGGLVAGWFALFFFLPVLLWKKKVIRI